MCVCVCVCVCVYVCLIYIYTHRWKKYLTQLQIVQFVIDIGACVYASSHEPVVGPLGLGWLNRPHCNGTLTV